ncbi:acyl-CoA dehydrogenase family protein [Alkalihalobacillus sp. LMS6]|uniref:acyl-CoA dehydrogenase family protein n=1 Tax=Alkalihalobacillus sp. LMS6 TaxID=2924034 RepID=UPI0020D0F4FD|nr:acyl-CoA dehydrogenase family protein [Alkalihalobacillus sp. LMS6]UTR07537.1 acyl-CoA dehydrogenase family protein [Alkalihalobacillus sp. LMS6]
MSNLAVEPKTTSEKEMLDLAHRVGKLAEEEAQYAEKEANVSAKVIDLMKETGLTRMMLPQEYEGPKVSIRTFGKVVRTIATYNISAAWLAYLYPLHNMLPAYLPKEGQEEIINQGGLISDIFAAVGTAKKDGDGYRVSGTWNFVSGVNHSDWVGIGVKIQMPDGDRPEMCLPLVRTSEVKIVENWDTFGLRGSGSNQIVLEDVYVPMERIFRVEQSQKTRRPVESNYDASYPLYHVPMFPAFYFGFPEIALGGTERIISEFKRMTEKRVRLMDGVTESESPRSQRVLAEITTEFKAAEALMDKYIDLLENYESDGEQTTAAEFFAIRTKIIKTCSEIALRVLLTLGGGALYKGGPIELFFRDILAVATHKTSLYEDSVAAYGQELFGFESGVRG